MEKTITLANGLAITMRRPSEAELLRYLDKRRDIQLNIRPSGDANDDGDLEIIACVTSPSRDVITELFEEYPRVGETLLEAFGELGGALLAVRRDDAALTEENRAAGKRVIGCIAGEMLIALKKLSRFEIKALEFEAREQKQHAPRTSALAVLVRSHVVASVEQVASIRALLDENPFVVARLGQLLYEAALLREQVEQGKS